MPCFHITRLMSHETIVRFIFLPWQVMWLMLATIIRIYICGNIEGFCGNIKDIDKIFVTRIFVMLPRICVTILRIPKTILRIFVT